MMSLISALVWISPQASAAQSVSLRIVLISETPTGPVVPTPVDEEEVRAEPSAPEVVSTRIERRANKAIKAKKIVAVPKKVTVKRGIASSPVPVAKPKSVKPVPRLLEVSPRTNSDINFNGLIDSSGRHKKGLEKRIKVKTADQHNEAGEVAEFDFDDVNVQWEPQAEPMRTREPAAAAPSRAATSGQMNLQLRPKGK
ncbi:MAG: hypothetical protein KF799_04230 [Bdellovibrionales bacterium]|nr:hypothetical protein [Bdellovibrionales bacterium]